MASLKRIAFTDETSGEKVTMEDMLDKFAEKQQKKCEELLDKKLDTLLDAKIIKALDPINKRLDVLEKATRHRSSSAPPSFVPSFLEVKVFVDKFEDAATHRVQADTLFQAIKAAI